MYASFIQSVEIHVYVLITVRGAYPKNIIEVNPSVAMSICSISYIPLQGTHILRHNSKKDNIKKLAHKQYIYFSIFVDIQLLGNRN